MIDVYSVIPVITDPVTTHPADLRYQDQRRMDSEVT